jgi:hypothetical protein
MHQSRPQERCARHRLQESKRAGLFCTAAIWDMPLPIRHARLHVSPRGQRHGQPACNRNRLDCRLCVLVPSSVVSRLSRATSKVRQQLLGNKQAGQPCPRCIAVPCMRLDACHSIRPHIANKHLFPLSKLNPLNFGGGGWWLTGLARRLGAAGCVTSINKSTAPPTTRLPKPPQPTTANPANHGSRYCGSF